MALYTGKGDKGDTYFFNCNQRFSKSSEKAEALGSVDETNSLIGFCRVKSKEFTVEMEGFSLAGVLKQVQEDLFVVQANLAGSNKKVSEEKITRLEEVIIRIEKEMPPIKKFFIPGGSELSALLDFTRCVARRAERATVALNEKEGGVDVAVLSYLNRLSSFLYALARLVNFKLKIEEDSPSYE